LALLLDFENAARRLPEAHKSAYQGNEERLVAAVVGRVEDGLQGVQLEAAAVGRLPEVEAAFLATGARARRTAAIPTLTSAVLMPRPWRMAEAVAFSAAILVLFAA
jgi:hypothetical protein